MKYGNAKVIGRWMGRLLALAVLLAFLVAAEDSCTDKEVALETPPDGVPTATFEVVATATTVPAPTEDGAVEEVAYRVEALLLLDEVAEVLDDYSGWLDDTVTQYELGVTFPDTVGAEASLDRARDVTRRVESLDVPPAFQESHGLWLKAQYELVAGMELGIAGVEQADPDLIDQGTARVTEANRLLGLASDVMP